MAMATARRLGLAAALALSLCLAFATTQARSDAGPAQIATGAGLDWGIKASFRNYIEGPIATGTITPSEGATRNPDGSFHFPIGEGTYDPATKGLVLRFDGSIHMSGHGGVLNMTVREPRVVITPLETNLYAKVVSAPVGGGGLGEEADVHFAALDITNVTPAVAGGVTSWTGVPAFVAAGAIAPFAGHYSIGTALDPLSFSYEGDGGKPEPALETWTTPGSRTYDTTQERTFAGSPFGVIPLAYDAGRDLLHVAHTVRVGSTYTQHIQAFDPTTLEPIGAEVTVPGLISRPSAEVAYDEPNAALLIQTEPSSSKELWEVRWNEGAETYQTTKISSIEGTPVPANIRVLRYDEAGEVLYGLLGNSAPNQGMFLAYRDGVSWWWPLVQQDPAGNPGTTQPFPAEGRTFSSMDVLTDGTVVLTAFGGDGLGEFDASVREAVVYFLDKWEKPLLFGIPESKATVLDEQLLSNGAGPPTPNTNGYTQAFAGPGNRLYLVEMASPQRVLQLRKDGWNWTILSEGQTNLSWSESGVVSSDSTLFKQRNVGSPTPAISGDRVIGQLPQKGPMVAGPDGSIFLGKSPVLIRYEAVGVSPTISVHPDDQALSLAANEQSGEVSFAAAASGTPDPTVQWQTRAPGAKAAGAWGPIEGETETTLTVTLERADSGRQYRALFSNHYADDGAEKLAGEIATAAATVTVDYAPSVVNQPEDASVVEGEDGVFKVMPAGAPYPQITWQRQVGGFWQNLDPSSGDFEISGGLLRVLDSNLEMSGSLFRARIENSVAAVNSRAAGLTVSEPPPSEVTFGSGRLDWGVKQSFREYIAGPIADGSYTATSGASVNPDGTIGFDVLGGSYDTTTDSGEVATKGTVRFTAHEAPGLGPMLDLTIADPRIELDGDAGALIADVKSRSLSSGTVALYPEVELASLDASALTLSPLTEPVPGFSFTPLPASLTATGAPAFSDFYPPGAVLDPLSLTAFYESPRPTELEPGPESEQQAVQNPQSDESSPTPLANPAPRKTVKRKRQARRCRHAKRERKKKGGRGKARCKSAKARGA